MNNNRILGTGLLIVSAILISAQYITTAILTLNIKDSSKGTFFHVFDNSGVLLIVFSILFFLIGLILIGMDLIQYKNNK